MFFDGISTLCEMTATNLDSAILLIQDAVCARLEIDDSRNIECLGRNERQPTLSQMKAIIRISDAFFLN